MGTTELVGKMSTNSRPSASHLITHLGLVEHPGEEDGFFHVPFEDTFCVVGGRGQQRTAASIAYFLQKKADALSSKTMFFRCQSTEMLFFHYGDPLTVYILPEDGTKKENLEKVVVGLDVEDRQLPAFPVPKNRWFTRVVESTDSESYTLFSCSLAPGFNIEDFEAATLDNILDKQATRDKQTV